MIMEKNAIIFIYISPLILLFSSWFWQYLIEKHYKNESSISLTISISIIVYAIVNCINSILILGITVIFIASLVLVMVLIITFIILEFTEHDKISIPVLILIFAISLYELYEVIILV